MPLHFGNWRMFKTTCGRNLSRRMRATENRAEFDVSKDACRRCRKLLPGLPPIVAEPTLTMAIAPEAVELVDPDGALRRAGLDLAAVPVVVAKDEWTWQTRLLAFRVWRGRLWRKDVAWKYFGGYQIKSVSLDNAPLVAEWLAVPAPDAAEFDAEEDGCPFCERPRAAHAEPGVCEHDDNI